jgi:Flp pilus assembly protein TadG
MSQRGMSRRARCRKDERGQVLVEFALLLPLLLLIVVGILQFGLALNFWLDLQRIANQGARWAVVNSFPDCATAKDVQCTSPTLQGYLADEPVSAGLNDKVCVDITFPSGAGPDVGDPVKVEVYAPFRFVALLNLAQIRLGADATMRLEQKPGRYSGGLGGTTC